ncbi:hypothetical protein F4821DRAFT_264588 [Hypoxylon rubiginosum]|uniref:Uncharacterized protein n=1 Tax=Hypoxylon rubiginosum TaxID=110542 RepID=A0ACC0CMY6_9PEZI|nr:hypothetical protein F4821DRAFT_264588 [Hypoxylon rubiginosum]
MSFNGLLKQEPYEPPNVTYDIATSTSSFLDTQYKLFEVLYLLRDTYEALGKHQCYASHFEAAYWAENRRLQDAVEANKTLSHQLEQLQTHIPNNGRCRVLEYPNLRPSMHRLSPIHEEPEPHEDEADQMLQVNTAEKHITTEGTDLQVGFPSTKTTSRDLAWSADNQSRVNAGWI